MIELNCGTCAWWLEGKPPKGVKIDVRRGHCTFNPPQVFPMPTQGSNLTDLAGKQQVGFLPMMMRPILDVDAPLCGRFAPNEEALKWLGRDQRDNDECDGCADGTCVKDCHCDKNEDTPDVK